MDDCKTFSKQELLKQIQDLLNHHQKNPQTIIDSYLLEVLDTQTLLQIKDQLSQKTQHEIQKDWLFSFAKVHH